MESGYTNRFDHLSDDLVGCILKKLLWNPNASGVCKALERVRLGAVCKRFRELVIIAGCLDWDISVPEDEQAFLRYMLRQRKCASLLTKVSLTVICPVNVAALLHLVVLQARDTLKELHLFLGEYGADSFSEDQTLFVIVSECKRLRVLDIFLWGRAARWQPLPRLLCTDWFPKPFPCLKSLTLYGYAVSDATLDSFVSLFPVLESLELLHLPAETYTANRLEQSSLKKVFWWGNEQGGMDIDDPTKVRVPRSLEKVVALMRSQRAVIREKAVELLFELSEDPETQKAIAQIPGCLKALVSLLEDGQTLAGALLQDLATEYRNKEMIARVPGCVQALLSLLEGENEEAQDSAARTLASLAEDAEAGKLIARVPEFVQRLVDLVDNGSTDVQLLSLWILEELAKPDVENSRAIAAVPGCLNVLVALLEDAAVSMGSATLLWVLCNDGVTRQSVAAVPELIPRLFGLLASDEVEQQKAAAVTLQNVGRDVGTRTELAASPEFLQAIVCLVQGGRDDMPEVAAKVLLHFTSLDARFRRAVAGDLKRSNNWCAH